MNIVSDITAQVTSAQGWTSPVLAANDGAQHFLEVDITPNSTAQPNEQQLVTVTAAYAINPSATTRLQRICACRGRSGAR